MGSKIGSECVSAFRVNHATEGLRGIANFVDRKQQTAEQPVVKKVSKRLCQIANLLGSGLHWESVGNVEQSAFVQIHSRGDKVAEIVWNRISGISRFVPSFDIEICDSYLWVEESQKHALARALGTFDYNISWLKKCSRRRHKNWAEKPDEVFVRNRVGHISLGERIGKVRFDSGWRATLGKSGLHDSAA